MSFKPSGKKIIYFLSIGLVEKLVAGILEQLQGNIGDSGIRIELVNLSDTLTHISDRIHFSADNQQRQVFRKGFGIGLAVCKFNTCKEIVEETIGSEESALVVLDVLLDFLGIT